MDNCCHFRMLIPVAIYNLSHKIEKIKGVAVGYLRWSENLTCQLVDCLNERKYLLIEGSCAQSDIPRLEIFVSYLRDKLVRSPVTMEIYQARILRW